MRILRAALALAVLIAPPALVTLFVRLLYGTGWVMTAIVFLVLISLWGEGVRALRRMD